jgi:hypothetical protein
VQIRDIAVQHAGNMVEFVIEGDGLPVHMSMPRCSLPTIHFCKSFEGLASALRPLSFAEETKASCKLVGTDEGPSSFPASHAHDCTRNLRGPQRSLHDATRASGEVRATGDEPCSD